MAALEGDDFIRALDITIDAVLRHTKGLTQAERDEQMRAALNELLTEETP